VERGRAEGEERGIKPMRWSEFDGAAPELARRMRERFDATGVVFVATLRRDGSPRISPVEFKFWEGDLTLGMMWQSKKALDLLRDPRCEVHATVRDKDEAVQYKLHGRAIPMREEAAHRNTLEILEQTGWNPEPYHLFALDIESATHIRFEGEEGKQVTEHWVASGEQVAERAR
jgi:hypothetical protein